MTGRKCFAWLIAIISVAVLWAGALQAQNTVRARIVHAASHMPAADFYINGELAIADLSYGEDSAFFSLPAGRADLLANIAGTASPLLRQSASVDGDASAIVLTARSANPFQIIPEDLSPLDFGMTRLQIVNALSDDIDIVAFDGNQLAGEDIEPGASFGPLLLPAGQVTFSAMTSGADGDAARKDFISNLAAGTSNMLLIHGDSDDPHLLQATEAADADGGSGLVRFVHAVRGAAPIDLKIDDHMIVPLLAFGNPSERLALPGGSHQLTLSLGGTVVASTQLAVSAGQMRTVVIMGTPASLMPVAFTDSLRDMSEDSALVSLVNAVPNSSVRRLRLESGAIVAADVGFGEDGGAARIVPGMQSMTMILDIGDDSGTIHVRPSHYYAGSYYNLIALSGSAFAAPGLLIAETSLMRHIDASSPTRDAAAQDETEQPVAGPAVETEDANAIGITDDAPPAESAAELEATVEQISSAEIEADSEQDVASDPDTTLDAGPSLVLGPYAIVDLDPSARLQLRQFPSSDALSLGLLPGRTELIVLGRRGLTEFYAGETSELPIDLGDYTTDPAAALYPAQDLPPAETWLFVMYQTEDGGALVGWANAFYLQVYDATGGKQRLASLPMVRQNRAGSTFNTEMRPPDLSDHVTARVYRLNPGALLNMRTANSPDSEVMAQLAPDTTLSLIGFDEADEWAYVDYAADTGQIVRGWVSATYIQLLLNGEPVLLNTLRALDETVAPQISSQMRGSIRSGDASGPTPIAATAEMMRGIVGEILLDPGAMLHLRRHPNINAESLAMIPAGTKVAISGITQNAEWLKTSYADQDGWISAHYVALLLRGRFYHRDYVESLLPMHDNAGNSTG